MKRCHSCGKQIILPYICKFCGLTYCSNHRLPEQHDCKSLPKRNWYLYARLQTIYFLRQTQKTIVKKQSIPIIETIICPECNSKILSFVPDIGYKVYECRNCGYKWKYPDTSKKFLSEGKYHFERNPNYKKKSFWNRFKR